mmetsp:Transcript_38195/g.79803  ORF Transcript_38195/g.79803 Transcript_38195/m.79803 type:complete len:200 (-) Transcript_38195:90-689(-)
MLFWFHLMQAPLCLTSSPELYQVLRMYAAQGCMVGLVAMALAQWHNRLLTEAARRAADEQENGSPPETLSRLETRAYDATVFGDGEGALFPSECAICLGTWEPDDAIKVTPCKHAFHEECIGSWLKTARTCALCRLDLVKGHEESGSGAVSGDVRAPVRRFSFVRPNLFGSRATGQAIVPHADEAPGARGAVATDGEIV